MNMHRGPVSMSDEQSLKLDELDRLLNDPDVKMEPNRIWALAAEIAQCGDINPGHTPA